MFKRVAVGVFCVLMALTSLVGMAQDKAPPPEVEGPSFHLGIGAKLLDGIPFAVAAARYGSFGVDIGAGFSFTDVQGTGVTMFWYNVLGKYYFRLPWLPWDFLHSYLGGGAIGLGAAASISVENTPVSVTISALGAHLTSGAELRFGHFAVFFGGDWLFLTQLKITAAGLSLTLPIAYGGEGYHVGVRYDF